MKKWIIIALSSILLGIIIIAILTSGFKKGFLSGKIYRPENVYEEIWNLLLIEQHTRNQTVLTTATEGAYEDWDFGIDFVGIMIPEYALSICWQTEKKELLLLFSIGRGEYASFIYNYKSKTLYGDTEFSYLMDNFLTHYFEWCASSSDFSSGYSADSLGNFKFEYVNPIYNRK